jgi:glycosyltransferase involved in cell wall biosynthesis
MRVEEEMISEAKPERGQILLVHPTGNQNVREAVRALEEAGALAGFETTIAWEAGSALGRLLPGRLRQELERRSYAEIPKRLIGTHPWREAARLVAERLGWEGLTRLERGALCFDRVCAELDRAAARRLEREKDVAGVYCYDDCAEQTFTAAKRLGVRRIFDLPIGYHRAWAEIAEQERALCPEWAATLTGVNNSAAKLKRKDREIGGAEAIVVASSFTAKTLEKYPQPLAARVFVVPYGAPELGPARGETRRDQPLRLLFVGLLSQRKGIGYLMSALEHLAVPWTLTLVGQPIARPAAMEKALNENRWIPTAPHEEVLRLMRAHDVLVFPSLFEGFGLVLLEAMAQGMVVIATPHTAAPDLFADGDGGFVVPIRSADAIAERLTQLGEDRALLAAMSAQAQAVAARWNWKRYRDGLMEVVRGGM